MNNPQIDRDEKPDVSITDLIAEVRANHPIKEYTEHGIPVFDEFDRSTETRTGCSRCKSHGPCDASRLAEALEAVTVPTENERERIVSAMVGVRSPSMKDRPIFGEHPEDIEDAGVLADAIIAAGCRLPTSTVRNESQLKTLADEVEITAEMVDRVGRVMYASWGEWSDEDIHAEGIYDLVRDALVAALGGGE